MKGDPTISPIYLEAEPNPQEPDWEQWSRIERLRRKAWLEAGVISIVPSDLPEHLRAEIIAWAEESYGLRSQRGGAA